MKALHSAVFTLTLCLLPALPVQAASPASLAPQQGYSALGLSEDVAKRQGPEGFSFQEAYARSLLYSAGYKLVFQHAIGLMLDAEVARRQEAGEPIPDLSITDEMVEAEIQKKQDEFLKSNPQLDFWEQLGALGFNQERYRVEVQQLMRLDGLFFPPDPEKWSPILEQIFRAGQENSFWESMILPLKDRAKEAMEKGEPFVIDPTTKQLFLRPTVLRWLMENVEIKEPFHGLPEGVALQVGGQTVSTASLLDKVMPIVGPVERERAASWVEVTWAATKALKEKGVLLSADETMAIIAEEKKEYVNSPISYEQVVLQFLGFPSMEAYHQYHRLRMSFKKTLPDPLPVETMRAHLDGHGSFLRQSKVNAEVILLSARDPETYAFPRQGDPYGDAHKRALKAAEDLKNGVDWSTVLLTYSDYPDAYPGAQPGMPQPHHGRFGLQARNPLREFLGENDYTEFLLGNSIADDLFFESEPEVVYGPVRGARGWYIYRLLSRSEPTSQMYLTEEEVTDEEMDAAMVVKRHRYLATDDYLTVHFNRFVNEILR
ncbi:MAG: hypothetical protein DWQ01_03545 [Planctomycetota bacterium]|nr:MAG: hypothetical protein DWQ01_03545 [Planctomycetota bacterium]